LPTFITSPDEVCEGDNDVRLRFQGR